MGQRVRRELQQGLQLDNALKASLSTLVSLGSIAPPHYFLIPAITHNTPGVNSGPNVGPLVVFVPPLSLTLKQKIDGSGLCFRPDPEALVCD